MTRSISVALVPLVPLLSFLSAASLALGSTGCTQEVSTAPLDDADAKATPPYDRLQPSRFNQLAVRLNLPLYWVRDLNQNAAIEPNEVAALRFYPTAGNWVAGGAFTQEFQDAYEKLVALDQAPAVPDSVPAEDRPRREAVIEELDQGRPTLIQSDLSSMTGEEKSFLSKMLEAGALIDKLFARVSGITTLADLVPADDLASQSLFRRNWGPACVSPKTSKDPLCSAIPGAPKPKVDVYPATLIDDQGAFCKALEARSDAKSLLAPFVVVRGEGEALTAVPYTEAYKDEMTAIAAKLEEAAAVVTDPAEAALHAYLVAATQAFRDNNWEAADEAWARMNATNSKWYLRIGPDETYWEPCSQKAAFHMTLARINLDSLAWQNALKPILQEMEDRMAALAGAPYAARAATFHLPDFIDIVANCGDDRQPIGAVAGQSLPNWGPVANEGRGRTMVMANLDNESDPIASRKSWAEGFLTPESISGYSGDAPPEILTTILHEATHNLGPSHEYKVNGLTDDQIFGGTRATLFEELKAESGALWYLGMLVEKGIITADQARQAYANSFMWSLSFLSSAISTEAGFRNPYSQLAAIEVGVFMDEGAIRFDANAMAANGTDQGAFALDYEKLPAAAAKLMQIVVSIKAKGDSAAAEALTKRYVDGMTIPVAAVSGRFLSGRYASFVYSITY